MESRSTDAKARVCPRKVFANAMVIIDQVGNSRILIRWAALAIALAMSSGCSIARQTVEVAQLGPADRVLVYESGQIVSEHAIAEDSDEDRTVRDWLRSHPDGWQADLHSYAPSRSIRGPRFTLDFHKGLCILNYRTKGEDGWVQVSRPLGVDEDVPEIFARPR